MEVVLGDFNTEKVFPNRQLWTSGGAGTDARKYALRYFGLRHPDVFFSVTAAALRLDILSCICTVFSSLVSIRMRIKICRDRFRPVNRFDEYGS
jgi:hypothetical protein